MKTLAEKIADLKVAETKAWDTYQASLVREINALLKRMGIAEKTTQEIYEEVTKEHDYVRENKYEDAYNFTCYRSEVMMCYHVVFNYAYIGKLWEKYHRYLHQLMDVEKAVK